MSKFTVSIKGYQSVAQEATLEVQGLTVLNGQSFTGKSAIFRAILSLVRNQRGAHFINAKQNTALVTIQTDEISITFEKGRKSAKYIVDGEEYYLIDRNPPKDLAKLGILPVTVGGTDFWPQIQKQDEGNPFLIGDISPNVAAELLVSDSWYESYVAAHRLAQKDLATQERDLEKLERGLADLKLTLGTLATLRVQIQTSAANVERLQKSVETATTRRARLETTQEEYQTVSRKFFVGRALAGDVVLVPPTRGSILTRLQRDWQCLHTMSPHPLVDLRASRLEQLVRLQKEWHAVICERDRLEIDLHSCVQEIEEISEKLEDGISSLGICPFCNTPVLNRFLKEGSDSPTLVE